MMKVSLMQKKRNVHPQEFKRSENSSDLRRILIRYQHLPFTTRYLIHCAIKQMTYWFKWLIWIKEVNSCNFPLITGICNSPNFLACFFTGRGWSRAAATSKMEHFAIIVNGWKPLTIITKYSLLDVAAALDPPLTVVKIIFCHVL